MSDYIRRPTPGIDSDFDPSSTDLISLNVEDAIKEIYYLTLGSSKSFVFCSYNGNANVGRYLEFFNGISSDEAPIYVPGGIEITAIVSRTVAADATCTIGWYNITPGLPGTLLHTTTFTAQKQVVEDGGSIFILPPEGSLALKIDSGSINKPHVYFIARGSD